MNIFYQPAIGNGALFLDPEESRHCVKALRKRIGDEIHIVDGHGGRYTAVLTTENHKKCEFEITNSVNESRTDHYIQIAIAPTKNMDRLEWFVEKATEIGIDEISIILTQNSERQVVKLERLEKKVIMAMKQSLKSWLPTISGPHSLQDFMSNCRAIGKYIAYVDFQNPVQLKDHVKPSVHNCVLIGPEGDFTEQELLVSQQHNWTKVGLGPGRLRTETAGLVACHILNIIR